MSNAPQLLNWPEQYLGIPWLTGGRNVVTGVDCWGLFCYIYSQLFGIDVAAYNVPQGTLAKPETIAAGELSKTDWQEVTTPRPGDVVVLGKGATFSHVGVYVTTPDAAIIHSAKGCLSCIMTLRALQRLGYTKRKFYRHVNSYIC